MEIIITLLIIGGVLLFLETLLPGMIAGIAGFCCLLAAVVLGYQESFSIGNVVLGVVLVGQAVGVYCWLKFFPDSRLARKFILRGAVGDLGVDRPELLNATGVALTQLRPSGTANINGQRVDVVAESGLIERDSRLKVVAVEGIRVVVRSLQD